MARVKTYTDWDGVTLPKPPSTALLPGELNQWQDDYEQSFAAWRDLWALHHYISSSSGPAAGTYGITRTTWGTPQAIAAGGSGPMAHETLIYLDPSAYAAGSRTAKMRLVIWLSTATTDPACSFTIDLRPVTTVDGASSVVPRVTAVGAAVTGSASTITPGANYKARTVGNSFTMPTAGQYALCLTVSPTAAVGSAFSLSVDPQYRQV